MNTKTVCPGTITIENNTPQCSESWVVVQASTPFHPSNLDSAEVAQYFSAGFTFWMIMWLVRLPVLHTVSSVLSMVNKWMNPRGN